MEKQNNIKEVNYIKGIAILLVFIGHAATPSFLVRPYIYEFIVQLIYSMHMPLFFLVSGFLAYKITSMNLNKDYLSFLKNKFYRLGIPFLIISFITNAIIIVFKQLFAGPISVEVVIDMIKTIFLYPENGVMGALWFLYTLFIISIISPIIVKLPLKLLIVVSLIFNIFTPKDISFLAINRISFFLVYFLIGIYFRKYYEDNKSNIFKNISTFKRIFILIIASICNFSYAYIIANQISMQKYVIDILSFICGISGMVIVLMVIKKIKNTKICNVLSCLGKYSIDIYIFSWFFQVASMLLITKILKINNYTIFFISNIIIGSLCLPFSIYILRRFKIFKFLFLGEWESSDTSKDSYDLNILESLDDETDE